MNFGKGRKGQCMAYTRGNERGKRCYVSHSIKDDLPRLLPKAPPKAIFFRLFIITKMFSLTRARLSHPMGGISQLSRIHTAQVASTHICMPRDSSLVRVTSQADRLAFSTSLRRLNTANTISNAGASGTTYVGSPLFELLKNGMQIVDLVAAAVFLTGVSENRT